MKVAILGYGKSGKAAEIILRNRGADAIEVFDDSLSEIKNIADLDSKDFNLIVVSPGIDLKKYPMIDRDKVISEIDIAYSLVNDPEKITVVTGTNGKSTTAYLLEQILHAFNRDIVLCGNIGKPFTDVVGKEKHDYYIVELSSFQIELLKLFKAKRLVITNIDFDHLDRYESFNNYIEAKLKIVKRIEDNGLIVTNKDKRIYKYIMPYEGVVIQIDDSLSSYPFLDKNILSFGKKFYFDISSYKLIGNHNIYNLIYALTVADNICDINGDITDLVASLKGLPHRAELLKPVNGITFINDSKSTTVASTRALLEGIKKECVLILGGHYKGDDFSKLIDNIKRYVEALIIYGEAIKDIKSVFDGVIDVPIYSYEHLDSAIYKAYECAKKSKLVLFSPACSSFDQFSNFEERGGYFKEIVEGFRECKYIKQ